MRQHVRQFFTQLTIRQWILVACMAALVLIVGYANGRQTSSSAKDVVKVLESRLDHLADNQVNLKKAIEDLKARDLQGERDRATLHQAVQKTAQTAIEARKATAKLEEEVKGWP
jgi:chromosome segregation ATPase